MRYDSHDFYCLNCGHKGIPCQRPDNRRREPYHRKKLYCIFCHLECNHIEINTEEQRQEFIELFEAGEFVEEAKTSINFIQGGD